MKQIETLLRDSIGLHAATVGSAVVEHTVRTRMARLGLTNLPGYLDLLRKSPTEWNTLVETVVVTETWFFREKHPFSALIRLAVEEWLSAGGRGVLRLLSIPCASGEEPYSMAMALLDAGFSSDRFRIDAVDISARALAFARRGIYGRNSFRGGDLDFRARHFVHTRNGYILNPAVRRQVHFSRGNVLSHECLPETGVYDFIFCRNLLIYFDRPTQAATVAKLRRLLTPGGVLFTGGAELPLALEHGFEALSLPRGFACRRIDKVPRANVVGRRAAKSPSAAADRKPVEAVGGEPGLHGQLPAHLAKARELAGLGQLAEAAALCESHLRESGASSEAFFILGLVQDAAGADAAAGEFYRKAIYLEPNHVDALRQWASLAERNGRREHAMLLRQRAVRRQPENTPELWNT